MGVSVLSVDSVANGRRADASSALPLSYANSAAKRPSSATSFPLTSSSLAE